MYLQRLFARKRSNYKPTEEFLLPLWIDKLFEHMLGTERRVIGAGLSFPFGGSRFVVAKLMDQ